MKYSIVISCLFASAVITSADEWRPPREFLQAVRTVESSNGKQTYGDNGDSLGDFQLSEAAWLDVNDWRKARQLKTYSYSRAVLNSYISRVYASDYISILHHQLHLKLRRPPSSAELYAAYNIGLSNFARCGYRLSHVNPVTRERCRQIVALLAIAMD